LRINAWTKTRRALDDQGSGRHDLPHYMGQHRGCGNNSLWRNAVDDLLAGSTGSQRFSCRGIVTSRPEHTRRLNMRRILGLPVILILVSLLAAACSNFVVIGSGNLVTKSFDFADFSSIEAGGTFRVEVVRDNGYSITINTDDNVVDLLRVSKSGSTLKLALAGGRSYNSVTLEARVTMPELRGLDLSGASRGTVSGFDSSTDLNIDVSGASRLEVDDITAANTDIEASGASRVTGAVHMAKVRLDVSGASTLELSGTADEATIEGSGASRLDLENLALGRASVDLSGATSGTVNVIGRLDIEVSGGSTLHYTGNPTIGNLDISGGSKVNRK